MFFTDLYFKNKQNVKTIFLIDIFHMKNINASYGLKNGDAVLKQFRKVIIKLLKTEVEEILNKNLDIKTQSKIKKYYSDVFAVTFYADLPDSVILEIKDSIIQKLQTHQFNIYKPDLQIYISSTIGCSKSSHKELIIYAEKALHNAKQHRENFIYFDANLYKNESTNNDLVELIKYNIDNKTVEPYFQAIACNETYAIVKHEALMRIFDKQGNVLLPGVFLEKSKEL